MRYRSLELLAVYFLDGAFTAADDLWSAFQSRLVDTIILGQGQAQVMTPETNRVDWDAVHNELMGN